MLGWFVAGGLAIIGFALFGTKKGQALVADDAFMDLAMEWDSYPADQKNATAARLMRNLIATGDPRAMVNGAEFLEAMDRPEEALNLRHAAALAPV